MMKEVNIKVKKKYKEKLIKGYPLIQKDALIDNNCLIKEGIIIRLIDENNKFIAKGYYGKQNKGNGWILSYNDNEKIDNNYFKKKIQEAINIRKKMFENKDTTAFRVFNGEGDNIGGLTIDYYDGYYLINWYSQGIYEYRDYIIEALESLVNYKAIYQKKRFNIGGKYIEEDSFVKGIRANFPIIVKENGVNFAVYLNEGAMVGFFMDQRDVRNTIMKNYSNNKTVLNTFSYTGAFSVFSALGEAKKTTSVDLAKRSRKKTIEHFTINNIDSKDHEIIVEDVFKYFKYAIKKNIKFDMVIVDPPSFAKSKKYTFSASKDYTDLLKQIIEITNEKGIIVASTNCSSFNMETFRRYIDKAFRETNNKYEVLEEFSLPSDFTIHPSYKEGNYLKVVFIKKK